MERMYFNQKFSVIRKLLDIPLLDFFDRALPECHFTTLNWCRHGIGACPRRLSSWWRNKPRRCTYLVHHQSLFNAKIQLEPYFNYTDCGTHHCYGTKRGHGTIITVMTAVAIGSISGLEKNVSILNRMSCFSCATRWQYHSFISFLICHKSWEFIGFQAILEHLSKAEPNKHYQLPLTLAPRDSHTRKPWISKLEALLTDSAVNRRTQFSTSGMNTV